MPRVVAQCAMGALCPSRIIVHTYICECSVYEISLCSIIVQSCRFPVIEGIYLVGSCVQSFTSGGKRLDRLQSDTVRTELASCIS